MPQPGSGGADSAEPQRDDAAAVEETPGNHQSPASLDAQQKPMGAQEGDELDRELADAEIAGDNDAGFDDDKMSSSPSIADEDIDFEMVYALHHFNATVEGQANASKGEHMVLLDDSNSYWWLVRIVRDSSIGYLPAEHIETPTERLARLNKHRNVDLAANMLSDSAAHDSSSKTSRNPLKKAIRRRNAKTVTFTDPIFYEACGYDYSSDDQQEEGEPEEARGGAQGGDDGDGASRGGGESEAAERVGIDDGEDALVEPHSSDHSASASGASASGAAAGKKDDGNVNGKPAKKSAVCVLTPPTDPRTSSELTKKKKKDDEAEDVAGLKPRTNPTAADLRNPVSAIFHDETQGTKKLTLTPNLLREDSGTAHPPTKPEIIKGSGRAGGSAEKHGAFERKGPREESVVSPPPHRSQLQNQHPHQHAKDAKDRDGKRLKKGGSVLGNLFKKRSRKGKKGEDDDDVDDWLHGTHGPDPRLVEKQTSIDSSRSSESKDSPTVVGRPGGGDAVVRREKVEALLRDEQHRLAQQRREAQQQLAQRGREPPREREALQQQQQQQAQAAAPTLRRVEPEAGEGRPPPASTSSSTSTSTAANTSAIPTSRQPTEPVTASPVDVRQLPDALRVARPDAGQINHGSSSSRSGGAQQQQEKAPGDQTVYAAHRQGAGIAGTDGTVERLSESPEQITFHDAAERPELVDHSSGAESNEASSSPVGSTPEMMDRSNTFDTAVTSPGGGESSPPPLGNNGVAGGHTITRTWSDWSLRTYFDDDNDVKDMLVVVQQDRGDAPPQLQHPAIAPLFADSSRRLTDITKQLDGMLGEWLLRKGATSR